MNTEWIEADWLLTAGSPPQHGMRLAVDKDQGCIAAIEPGDGSTTNASGTTFLTPGLMNAHTHLELYAEAPIPLEAGETLADWILKVVARSRQMTEADRQQACRRSILEMVRNGTTCVNDITSTGTSLEVLSHIGLRGVVSPEFFAPRHTDKPDITAIVERFKALQSRFDSHPLLSVGISPHSPYNVTPQALQAVLQATEPSLVHIHAAETREEIQWFQTGASALDEVHCTLLGEVFGPAVTGTSPLMSLQHLLTSRWAVVHGVYLTEEELQVMGSSGAGLVLCPRSNHWISGETASHINRVLEWGIPVALGTDSRLSCPDLDLRAEARAAMEAFGQSTQTVFEWMTQGAAQVMGLSPAIGTLSPQAVADLVLWWTPESHVTDPYQAWLSPQTQALWVMVNGRTVMERDPEDLLTHHSAA